MLHGDIHEYTGWYNHYTMSVHFLHFEIWLFRIEIFSINEEKTLMNSSDFHNCEACYSRLKKINFIIILFIAFLIMILGMTAFELTKQFIFPRITIWYSHLITILFSSLLATIGTYFVLRDRNKLLQQTNELKEKYRLQASNLAELNLNLEAFSYSVSHDLKAPLQTINGFCKLLTEDYSERLDKEGFDYLNRISSSGHKMSDIIDDILALSKISRQELNLQVINLSEIALRIIDDLRKDHPEQDITIQIQQDLKTQADAKLIFIALNNLLGNAWKYTRKTLNPQIELGSYKKDGKCVYFVKDNGVGFDSKKTNKLFEPFTRLHSEKEFPGTGIGLAIVERAIKRHGGTIWAESEINKGAAFFFTLSDIPEHSQVLPP